MNLRDYPAVQETAALLRQSAQELQEQVEALRAQERALQHTIRQKEEESASLRKQAALLLGEQVPDARVKGSRTQEQAILDVMTDLPPPAHPHRFSPPSKKSSPGSSGATAQHFSHASPSRRRSGASVGAGTGSSSPSLPRLRPSSRGPRSHTALPFAPPRTQDRTTRRPKLSPSAVGACRESFSTTTIPTGSATMCDTRMGPLPREPEELEVISG